MISQFYIEVDEIADKYPCSEEQIREIHEILNGKENFDFYVQVGIPELVYTTCLNKKSFNLKKRKLYCELKEALTKFIVKNEKNDLDKIIGLILSEKNSNQTLQDILEKNILDICRSFFNVGNFELLPPKALKLYTNKQEQISILKILENYIDCYIGNKNFHILVSYEKGKPHLAILA